MANNAGLWSLLVGQPVPVRDNSADEARLTVSCGPWRGGVPKHEGHPWLPSVRGSHGAVCGPIGLVGKCVSRQFSSRRLQRPRSIRSELISY